MPCRYILLKRRSRLFGLIEESKSRLDEDTDGDTITIKCFNSVSQRCWQSKYPIYFSYFRQIDARSIFSAIHTGGEKTSSWGLVTSNNWSTLVEDDWMIFRRRSRRTTDCSHLVLGSKGRRLGGIGGGLFCFVFFPPKPFILKWGKVSKCPFRHSFGLKESPGQKWSKAASDRRCVARNQAPRR